MAEIYKRVCKECGKEFETSNKRKIFCSHNCRSNFNTKKSNSRKPKITYKKICIICGKEFVTTRTKSLCCSKECSYKHKIEQSQERYYNQQSLLKNVEVACPTCGKIFTKGRQKYCSPKCRGFNIGVLEKPILKVPTSSKNRMLASNIAKEGHKNHKTYGQVVAEETTRSHNTRLNMAYQEFKARQRIANV